MTSDMARTHGTARRAGSRRAPAAAGPQHAGDLGEGVVEANQWKAWATVTASTARVGRRDRLGGAVEDLDVGQHLGELRPHGRDRLDGDDVEAAADEQPGELAGAGGEVADAGAGPMPSSRRGRRRPRAGSRAGPARSRRRRRRSRRPPSGVITRSPRPRARRSRRGGRASAPTRGSRPSPCGGSSRPPRRFWLMPFVSTVTMPRSPFDVSFLSSTRVSA